ncbi:MAG: hypothetical protein IJW86_06155 [Clostridia bacterium]|nr:hypothetical protein [Clostridia bacterium]
MDENRKDELEAQKASPEAEEAALPEVQESPEEKEEASELEKELEDIREMFQQELDNASNENPLIQELEDISETDSEGDAEEEAEVRLCECCGENPCSDEFGEDYPYCNDCRELMKKYPMRWSGILMTLVMIAVFIASAFASASYAEDFITVTDAALNYDSGKVMTGMTAYYSYISSASDDTISMKAVKDILEGYNKTGYISDAASLIERIYSETQLKMPWYKKYANMIESANSLTKTYYKVAEVIEPVMNGTEYDYDEIMAQLDALYETTPSEEEGIEAYEPLFIEYYRYVVMSFNEEPLEAQLAQLKKVDEINDRDMEWAYLANYCALAARSGDGELVDKLYDRLIKINKEDGNAYSAKASYYRWLETPDPDKMLEICEEAKTNLPTGDISYMPTMAIAYLLKGEGALALETMDEYMSQSAYTVQTCNLYALCAAYNGNEDIYNEMKDILENSGYELSELVEKYKNDKLTINEVLADKGGSI